MGSDSSDGQLTGELVSGQCAPPTFLLSCVTLRTFATPATSTPNALTTTADTYGPQDTNQPQPPAPQRLSALYQYHNAPEVAPSHGLEYDDTVYPVSDKFPVVRESPSFDTASAIRYTGKHAVLNDNRPPRIIFGMKVKTFLMVAAVMALVVVGAAVGGAVGGKAMRENQEDDVRMGGTAEYVQIPQHPTRRVCMHIPHAPLSTYVCPH